MLQSNKLVTTVSFAAISIPAALNAHLLIKEKQNVQLQHSVSSRIRGLHVVHARNGVKDANHAI